MADFSVGGSGRAVVQLAGWAGQRLTRRSRSIRAPRRACSCRPNFALIGPGRVRHHVPATTTATATSASAARRSAALRLHLLLPLGSVPATHPGPPGLGRRRGSGRRRSGLLAARPRCRPSPSSGRRRAPCSSTSVSASGGNGSETVRRSPAASATRRERRQPEARRVRRARRAARRRPATTSSPARGADCSATSTEIVCEIRRDGQVGVPKASCTRGRRRTDTAARVPDSGRCARASRSRRTAADRRRTGRT